MKRLLMGLIGVVGLAAISLAEESKPAAVQQFASIPQPSDMQPASPQGTTPQIVKAVPELRPKLSLSFLKDKPPADDIQDPYDLAKKIPIIKKIDSMIPKNFAIADHQVTLTTHEVTILHHFDNIRSKGAKKDSTVVFGYDKSNSQIQTYLEVPLFYSPDIKFRDWSPYPIGNYSMRITRDNGGDDEHYYIRAVTRF